MTGEWSKLLLCLHCFFDKRKQPLYMICRISHAQKNISYAMLSVREGFEPLTITLRSSQIHSSSIVHSVATVITHYTGISMLVYNIDRLDSGANHNPLKWMKMV